MPGRVRDLSICFWIFLGCTGATVPEAEPKLVVGPVEQSLVTTDHVSEGLLVRTVSGDLVHIFRLDPGEFGSHVGDSGRIVQRRSRDEGGTWDVVEAVFDSEYDDRNVHGGTVDNGRIVVFFRQYDPSMPNEDLATVSLNLMYSDDETRTWSDPRKLERFGAWSGGTDQLNFVPGLGYVQAFYARRLAYLRYSREGLVWSRPRIMFDFRGRHGGVDTDEISIESLGDGRILALIRNQPDSGSGSVLQAAGRIRSEWHLPGATNLADGHYVVAPKVIRDDSTDAIIALLPDRRGVGGTGSNRESGIYVYVATDLQEHGEPQWSFVGFVPRPIPSQYRFYGYPTIARLNDQEFLVVFTDGFQRLNGREGADLFQFRLSWVD